MMLMILFSVCAHAEKVNVNLQVGGIDKDNMDVPLPKSPILTPEMEQDGNTLYLSSIHADYTLCLLDENENVVYTTYIPASVSSVVDSKPVWNLEINCTTSEKVIAKRVVEKSTSVSVHDWPKGLYIVQAKAGESLISKKIYIK